jgi:hypothetical protein
MSNFRRWLLLIVVLLQFVSSWPSVSLAYYAPLQDVTAWMDGSTVHMKVYDPKLGKWMEKEVVINNSTQTEVTCQEGFVVWRKYWNEGYTYGFAVYDPDRESWQIGDEVLTNADVNLFINDGVIMIYPLNVRPTMRTYNPFTGNFNNELFLLEKNAIERHVNAGIVANKYWYWDFYEGNHDGVDIAIYDETDGKIHEVVINTYPYSADFLAIDDSGTVTFWVNDVQFTRGYNPNTRQRYAGPTLPRANFAVRSQSNGIVFITDMSIGATSRHIDFGDGTTSSERSPTHTYAETGVYTVVQTVSGPGGNDTATRTVTIVKKKHAISPVWLLLQD